MTTTLPPTGRRKREGAVNSGVMGTVYLIHLSAPLGADRPRVAQAQHYVGWCEAGGLDRRLAEHERGGKGSALLAAAAREGIGWDLARTWPGDRHRERQLKQSSATRYCPICKAQARLRAARERGEI